LEETEMSNRSSIIRLVAIAGVTAALWSPAAAGAAGHGRTVVPPGNSGASQYVEVVPTGGGNRPTSSIRPPAGSASNGSPSNSTSSASTGGTPGTGSIPAHVQRAFHRQGTTGAAALAFAKATAPQTAPQTAPPTSGARAAKANSGAGSSPLVSVLKAATGSSSGGSGLGASLPVIFILIAIAGLAYRVRRRRTA
jgi:hypothetical protein